VRARFGRSSCSISNGPHTTAKGEHRPNRPDPAGSERAAAPHPRAPPWRFGPSVGGGEINPEVFADGTPLPGRCRLLGGTPRRAGFGSSPAGGPNPPVSGRGAAHPRVGGWACGRRRAGNSPAVLVLQTRFAFSKRGRRSASGPASTAAAVKQRETRLAQTSRGSGRRDGVGKGLGAIREPLPGLPGGRGATGDRGNLPDEDPARRGRGRPFRSLRLGRRDARGGCEQTDGGRSHRRLSLTVRARDGPQAASFGPAGAFPCFSHTPRWPPGGPRVVRGGPGRAGWGPR